MKVERSQSIQQEMQKTWDEEKKRKDSLLAEKASTPPVAKTQFQFRNIDSDSDSSSSFNLDDGMAVFTKDNAGAGRGIDVAKPEPVLKDPLFQKHASSFPKPAFGFEEDLLGQPQNQFRRNSDANFLLQGVATKQKEEQKMEQMEKQIKRLLENNSALRETSFSTCSDGVPVDMASKPLHIAFLFSSPLVRGSNQNSLATVQDIDYENEVKSMTAQLNQTMSKIIMSSEVATEENFRRVVAQGPVVLHFSGHGIKNEPAYMGNEYAIHKNDGDILLIEDECGKAKNLFESVLKEITKHSSSSPELVYVSSCTSQFAGNVFLHAGAKHVICIRDGQKVLDEAAIKFGGVLYEQLFLMRKSVCDSFNQAQLAVRLQF